MAGHAAEVLLLRAWEEEGSGLRCQPGSPFICGTYVNMASDRHTYRLQLHCWPLPCLICVSGHGGQYHPCYRHHQCHCVGADGGGGTQAAGRWELLRSISVVVSCYDFCLFYMVSLASLAPLPCIPDVMVCKHARIQCISKQKKSICASHADLILAMEFLALNPLCTFPPSPPGHRRSSNLLLHESRAQQGNPSLKFLLAYSLTAAGAPQACCSTYLMQYASNRKLLCPTPSPPPASGCMVCGTAQVSLAIDTKATTLAQLLDKVCV